MAVTTMSYRLNQHVAVTVYRQRRRETANRQQARSTFVTPASVTQAGIIVLTAAHAAPSAAAQYMCPEYAWQTTYRRQAWGVEGVEDSAAQAQGRQQCAQAVQVTGSTRQHGN